MPDLLHTAAWVLPLGLTALAVILWRGWLKPTALRDVPDRAVGIGGADLIAGLGLMLLGMSLFPLIVGGLDLVDPATGQPPADATAMQHVGLTLLGQAVLQLPIAGYFIWRASMVPDGLRRAGVLPRAPGRELVTGLIGLVLALPLVFTTMLLAALVMLGLGQDVPELGHSLLEVLQRAESWWAIALLGVAVVLVAPLLEELIYRGLVQTGLLALAGREHRWTVVLVAAVLFGLTHGGAVAPHALPALTVLGALLGWLYERSGSLWPSIVVHAGFNLVNAGLVVVVLR